MTNPWLSWHDNPVIHIHTHIYIYIYIYIHTSKMIQDILSRYDFRWYSILLIKSAKEVKNIKDTRREVIEMGRQK